MYWTMIFLRFIDSSFLYYPLFFASIPLLVIGVQVVFYVIFVDHLYHDSTNRYICQVFCVY